MKVICHKFKEAYAAYEEKMVRYNRTPWYYFSTKPEKPEKDHNFTAVYVVPVDLKVSAEDGSGYYHYRSEVVEECTYCKARTMTRYTYLPDIVKVWHGLKSPGEENK